MYQWRLQDQNDGLVVCLKEELIKDGTILVKDCETLRGRLRRKVGRLNSMINNATRHKKNKIKDQSMCLTIYKSEIVNPREIEEERNRLYEVVESFKYA